jgi:hypothetical protein
MRIAYEKHLVTAFMAVVTCYFLAAVFAGATGGTGGLAGVVVFGFGAAFGLEYLWTAWPRLWGPVGEPTES